MGLQFNVSKCELISAIDSTDPTNAIVFQNRPTD
jgi:hypothetical protein